MGFDLEFWKVYSLECVKEFLMESLKVYGLESAMVFLMALSKDYGLEFWMEFQKVMWLGLYLGMLSDLWLFPRTILVISGLNKQSPG